MKNLNLYVLLFFVAIATMLQSCLSTSGLQTAKVVEKGETAWGVGVLLPKAEFIAGDSTDFKSFALEVSGRYGVTEKLDVGAKLTLLGTGGIDAKYQFLGDRNSKVAGSIGAGLGYLQFGSDGDNSSTLLDVTVPAYFSYHPTEAFAIYTSPRYIYRANGDFSASFYGGLAGIKVGKSFSLFAEFVYLTTNDEFYSDQTQINIGVGKNF